MNDKPKPRFELLLGGKGKTVAEQPRVKIVNPTVSAPPPKADRIHVRTREQRMAMTLAPRATAWWTDPQHRSPDGAQRLLQVLRLMVDGEWHDAPTLKEHIPGVRSYLVKGVDKGFLELSRASGITVPRIGWPGRPRDRWRLTALGRAFVEVMG